MTCFFFGHGVAINKKKHPVGLKLWKRRQEFGMTLWPRKPAKLAYIGWN